MKPDYKSTLFLPKTAFAMKGRLPEREPEWLQFWADIDLETHRAEARKDARQFVLHDGPPYANGHLHIGHALNKILKDIINRGQFMLGRAVSYKPGWDCHGLPIEWKIEEDGKKAGERKEDVPLLEFRQRCRDFAAYWVDIQRQEFMRLGISAAWDDSYTTMTFAAEAAILRELGTFLLQGNLIRGNKPVFWSVAEKTALAEAEVEYHDRVSTTLTVRFPVISSPHRALENAHILIWTTTPWTLAGNRAIAYGEEITYGVYEVTGKTKDSHAIPGEYLVCAEILWERVADEAGITQASQIARLKGKDLAEGVCHHPLRKEGYEFPVPLLNGDHVTTEAGTGFVHIAPGHGAEDFALGKRAGLDIPQIIDDGGVFLKDVPVFAGHPIFKADQSIIDALNTAQKLLSTTRITHAYPHSWRSKTPLIFRATPQWFISMDVNNLREKALLAIDQVTWIPQTERNRIRMMVESRPDWCVSRQRVWGVPIAIFINRQTGQPLREAAVMERIIAAVEKEGSDVWFTGNPQRFLPPDYDPEAYQPVFDILDVWFDSGSTHAFVLDNPDRKEPPADLYLEGSDQHRGWFQSSLLESCATRGRPPYQSVLTHGFVLDEKGRKMSKSLGNVISPQDVTRDLGADILRLWTAMSDTSEDLRMGPDILKAQTDTYRRLRNSLRFILGNLGAEPGKPPDFNTLPELERWILHRLWELDQSLRTRYHTHTPYRFFTALHHFCAVDLSAFYFDIRKDCLYCDSPHDPQRQATLWILEQLFSTLSAWLAPALCFTAEEAWQTRRAEITNPAQMAKSVHLRSFPEIPDSWKDTKLAQTWLTIRNLRRVITGAIEIERAEKRIGSSLEAHPVIFLSSALAKTTASVDWAEIAITSSAECVIAPPPEGAFTIDDVPQIGVLIQKAKGKKCQRCWKIFPPTAFYSEKDSVCIRCQNAMTAVENSASP